MAVTGIVPLLAAIETFDVLLGQGSLLPFGMGFRSLECGVFGIQFGIMAGLYLSFVRKFNCFSDDIVGSERAAAADGRIGKGLQVSCVAVRERHQNHGRVVLVMDGGTHAAQAFVGERHVVEVSTDVVRLRCSFLHHPLA